jgi:hypothetical protein
MRPGSKLVKASIGSNEARIINDAPYEVSRLDRILSCLAVIGCKNL